MGTVRLTLTLDISLLGISIRIDLANESNIVYESMHRTSSNIHLFIHNH